MPLTNMFNNQTDPNKDKRISFLSLYSTLAPIVEDAEKKAFELNERLYLKYPITMPSYKPSKFNSKPTKEGENCACGLPREERRGIKNGKEWRGLFCKRKVCPVIWLPLNKDIDAANNQDSLDDEAHKTYADQN